VQLRCILCRNLVDIDDETAMAKRAREDPGFVLVCEDCQRRNVERYGLVRERPNPILRHRRRQRRVDPAENPT